MEATRPKDPEQPAGTPDLVPGETAGRDGHRAQPDLRPALVSPDHEVRALDCLTQLLTRLVCMGDDAL